MKYFMPLANLTLNTFRKKVCKLVIPSFVSVFSLLPYSMAEQAQINVATYPFSPLQMMESNPENPGYAVEIINNLASRISKSHPDIKFNVKSYPFKRAYNMAEKTENMLFFSISRTPEREEKFHWIGEISPYELYFFKLKSNKEFNPESLSDIWSSGGVIAVQDKSNTEKLIQTAGFKLNEDYVTYPHYSNGIKMLFRHRFDMLPLTLFVAKKNTCDLGLDGSAIEPVFKVKELSKPLWLVANIDTPKEIVSIFDQHFNDMINIGLINSLQRKYLDKWEDHSCLDLNYPAVN